MGRNIFAEYFKVSFGCLKYHDIDIHYSDFLQDACSKIGCELYILLLKILEIIPWEKNQK